MPYLFILSPLVLAVTLNLPLGRWIRKTGEWMTLLYCLIQSGAAFLPQDAFFFIRTNNVFDFFIRPGLAVDNISRLVLFSIGIVGFVAFLIARSMLIDKEERFNFANLVLVSLAGLNGVATVTDIFSLYVFLEIGSAASFIMIAFNGKREALEGAFKYIIMSAVATIFMLVSIALLIIYCGETSFLAIESCLKSTDNLPLVNLAIGIFISGLFIKSGLVPFHGWLADAYSASPAPVSVFLAGIATKTLGIYTLIRVAYFVFYSNTLLLQVLLFVGAISILAGALLALGQNDLKRMLAYSSVSQMGYMVLSLGCGTPLGLLGAVFHLFNHAVFKSMLFVNSAALESKLGTQNMDRMGGLAQRMPFTGVSSVIASLSTAGIPPLPGFWSKLVIIIALWKTGHFAYAFVAVGASIITLAYMLVMQRRVFFGEIADSLRDIKEEAGAGFICAGVVLVAIMVIVGLLFPFLLKVIWNGNILV